MKKYNDIIKDIFQSRIEDVAGLTFEEKESLDKQKEIKDISDYITGLTEEQKKQANEYLDEVMSDVCDEACSLNEKYYRYGISDGVNIILTSVEIRKDVERRFKECQINL